jgi:hypothetical protein
MSYATEPCWALVGSSQFFLIPTLAYFLTGERVCGFVNVGIYLSSIAYHATKPKYPILLYADMVFAQAGNVCAIYTTSKYMPYSLPLYSVFLGSALTIYYYGRHTSSLAWDPDPNIATAWHATMHFILSGSAGLSILLAGSLTNERIQKVAATLNCRIGTASHGIR